MTRQAGPRGFEMSDDAGSEGADLPEMDFTTLVLSLSASAMVHLGTAPEGEQAGELNLPLAKQTIDILEVLKTKTAGNLEEAESHVIDSVLHELRLRYVEARG